MILHLLASLALLLQADSEAAVQLAESILNTSADPYHVDYVPRVLAALGGDPTRGAPNAWLARYDLNGDGVPEWIASVPQPDCSTPRGCSLPQSGCNARICASQVVVFRQSPRGFEPIHIFGHPPDDEPGPALFETALSIADLDGDNRPEVALQTVNCGAHTCSRHLFIGNYDGQTWVNRAVQPIGLASATLHNEPLPDGTFQIVLHGGVVSSVGAGLQREHSHVYALRNDQFELVADIPDPDPRPYFQVLDANTALANGDIDTALQLAHVARQAPEPRLAAYAAIEEMLVYAKRNDITSLVQTWAEIVSTIDETNNPYVEAARQLGRAFNSTGDPLLACTAMASVVQQDPTHARLTEPVGYNQEQLSLDRICPLQ